MVTHEEEHSTRGRSRLLFEIMRGDFLEDKWRDKSVKDALDLCLSCKGCKSECPVNVDMATYKAEFLSHYYAGRLRPPNAYAIGWIHWWSRLASHAPGLVNAAMHSPGLGNLAKRLARVSVKREIPRFAMETFTSEWKKGNRNGRARQPHAVRSKVILWPDTFNNYFEPSVLHSAMQVLKYAGFDVRLPAKQLCCGRPLYDYGMLTTAKRLLKNTIDTLRSEIRAGIPLVIIEPSCAAVFRDELKNMLPYDEDAKRLSEQTYIFSEFLEKHNFQPPKLEKKALVQVHCHHKSVMGVNSEQKLLEKLGMDCEVLDSGCCGMAGGFGYEVDHYDVSVAVGERVLLPAVRAASSSTLVIADGFSCREQIVQETGRNAFHPCQIVHMAINQQRAADKAAERKAA
jgi:Fe-S oxidoreductase